MEYTFISYSRRQLYFAEAIVLHLQKEGIETWFDIQKLDPGADWESTLKDGYENCQRLILVASQAALDSEYVEKEWNTALQNGREVILAAVEDVDVPERLRDCAVIDFRTNFNTAMERLVSYLTGNLPRPKDQVQAPSKFPYPLRMPFPIWFMIIASMWPYVWMLALAFSMAGEFSAQVLTYAISGPIVLGTIAFTTGVNRFWKHNLDHQGVINLVGFAFIFQLLLALPALLFLLVSVSEPGKPGWIIFVFVADIICFFLNIFFYRWFTNRSESLLRWFAAGQASQKLRRNCHGRLLGKHGHLGEDTFRSEPVSFFLHNDPGDRPMAGYIVRMLSKAGHHAVEDMSKAQKHLYLISNRTSRKMVEEASKIETSSNIFLLGSSINQSESLKNATKTQFEDLRRLDAKNVEMLANSLSYSDAWRRHYALETAPTNFEAFTVPTSVLVYRVLAYFQVAGYLSGGLFDLYTGSLVTAPFFLFLGVGIFFLVEYTLQRRIPLLIALSVLAGFPLLLSVLYSLLMVVIFIILSATFELPPQFLAIGGMSIFGISLLAAIPDVLVDVVVLFISRFWFPSFAPYAKDALGMDKKGRYKSWGRVFVVVTTIVWVALRLLTMNWYLPNGGG